MRRHLEALAAGLPPRGFAVGVASPATVELKTLVAWFPVELGDRPRPAADSAAVWALRRAMRRWQPDLIHAHGVKAALVALAGLPDCRRPVLATFHNVWRGGPLTGMLRLLVPCAAAVIAVSEAVSASLTSRGIRSRQGVVIPNGIDLALFPPAAMPAGARPFTVAFVGRLTEEKGIGCLLEAVLQWPASSPAEFLIAGEGPLRPAVEAAAAGAGSRLRFLGAREEIMTVYHAADAVVVPSLSEGQSLTALEAMSCGLPVVASRVGGLPEVIVEGESGLLAPPGDPVALGAALRRLAADPPLRQALGAAGRRRVEAMFTVDRMLNRLVDLYEKTMASGGRR